jgi:large subunit ribosomal protein L22
MPFEASHRYAHVTPRKARPVADLVRGLSANRALEVLQFQPRRAAGLLRQVIRSALANASQAQGVNLNQLVISKIYVNEGPLQKRGHPVARGRFHRIMKKQSHLHVVLDAPPKRESADEKSKAEAAATPAAPQAIDAKAAKGEKTVKKQKKDKVEQSGGRV